MEVVIAPDQKLRVQTKPVKKVTPNHLKIIKQMIHLTNTFTDPEGVGLASTQVGLDEQFFVAKIDEQNFKAFFNPKITKLSKKVKVFTEGCLSIPNYWGEVHRHIWADVEYINEKNQKIKERMRGLMAHIFQHEVDHLHGKLFMDLILEQKGRLFKVIGKDRAGGEVFEEVPL